jgi:tRNA G18 (ribose-2'-O)-methylase SpoU
LADADAILAFAARHALEPLALSPGGAETLAALAPPARALLLLGSEGPGLPPELMVRLRTVRIPMAPNFDSLNVATAGAIALHHLSRSA